MFHLKVPFHDSQGCKGELSVFSVRMAAHRGGYNRLRLGSRRNLEADAHRPSREIGLEDKSR
jgi:hypothetical protein